MRETRVFVHFAKRDYFSEFWRPWESIRQAEALQMVREKFQRALLRTIKKYYRVVASSICDGFGLAIKGIPTIMAGGNFLRAKRQQKIEGREWP